MKKVYLVIFAFLFSVLAFGQTTTSSNLGTGNEGDWTGKKTGFNPWDNGLPTGGMTIIIKAGEKIYIENDNVTVSGDPVHLKIYGILEFRQAGKLTLPAGSTVELIGDGDISAPNATNQSTVLTIGSVSIKSDKIDAITGPATLTEDNLECGGCAPQPVNLLHFTVTPQKSAVKIEWASSKAWDFSHYELERSADGKDFEYLAGIDAEENTDWVVNYSFEDLQPLNGISYYRLKAVDIDGSFEYKGIEVVQFAAAMSLKAYPNPSSNGSLNILTDHGADARVSLKDNSGRTVYAGTMQNAAKTIDTSSLQPGLYILIVEGAGAARQTQVIIQ